MIFIRTVCLAVILSFISVIPSNYAQKRPSVPSIKEYAKKNQASRWATDWFKLKEDERRYNNSVAGRQGRFSKPSPPSQGDRNRRTR
jgi:uncharacterized protein YxeA